MDEIVAAHDIGAHVSGLGGRFMLDPATVATGEGLGLDFAAFYGFGRAGVLGDVHPEVVRAAMFFFPAAVVESAWGRARAVMSPDEVTRHYAEACRDWGRAHLADLDGLDTVCALGGRVAGAADPAGRVLFAGWARVEMPDDPAGRAAQVLQVLREARGGWHVAAVMASGLTPLEAVMVHGGATSAALYGWPEPHPDPEPHRAAHAHAEELTDRCWARDLAVLTAGEREELAAVLAAIAGAVPAR